MSSRSRLQDVAKDTVARPRSRPQVVTDQIAERIESGEWTVLPKLPVLAAALRSSSATVLASAVACSRRVRACRPRTE